MKKGTMVPLFTEIPMRRRLELFREAGFESLMMSIDRRFEKYNGKLEDVIDMCKEIGISIDTIHAAYTEPGINEFWLESEEGERQVEDYIESLKFANKHNIKTVVFHLHFGKEYKLSEIGITRLKRMVKVAEIEDVNIAIENLYSYEELGYIFNRIQSPKLGMCFDCGHENFLTQGSKFINKFGGLLKAVHLHDNNGIADEHKPPFTGTIDWNYVAKGMANANEVNLDAEVKSGRPVGVDVVTESQLLSIYKTTFDSLTRLEKLIEKEKELNQENVVNA